MTDVEKKLKDYFKNLMDDKKEESTNEIGTYCEGCMFSYGSNYCINHCPKDANKQKDN